MRTRSATVALIVTMFVALLPLSARAAEPPPSFTVLYLGSGSPTAINDVDTVVGYRTDAATGKLVPLISTARAAFTTLPLPAGATAAFATDVNDSNVVVGVADFPTGRRAVRWTASSGTYTAEVLPLLTGETTAYATAINNQGQIVGARAGLFGTPFGFGWIYSDALGMVGLLAGYGWDAAAPDDINDNGVVLDSTQTFDLTTRTVSNVGLLLNPPVNGVVLNDAGQILGVNTSGGSLPIARLQRYTPGSGWLFITGTSRYTVAADLNEGGDVTYSEGLANAPGLYLDGLGLFALNDVISPADRTAGWLAVGGGSRINDAQVIATYAQNTITGQTGTVLLTPAGALTPPAAPTNLTATPHPWTASEPFVSIDLAWQNGDPLLTRTYEMERRLAGGSTWTPIALVPPAMGTFHQDTTVARATTYDYRVRAVGVAGPGPWSAIATATSPSDPATTTVRVSKITLSGSVAQNVATVTGGVTVRTSSGALVPSAVVSATWTLPGGGTAAVTATTNSRGKATLVTSGAPGSYRLTVTGVTGSGLTFDPASSVLTKAITV